MKKFWTVLIVGLLVVFSAGVAVAVEDYELEEGAEVGITAIGVELEAGSDVVANEYDVEPDYESEIVITETEEKGKTTDTRWPIYGGVGALVLASGAFIVLRKKS